jgi:hypothetical protein
MIVDKTMVDLSGRTCDKIGVAPGAFRLQGLGGGCTMATDSCLNNQPRDLWQADRRRKALGQPTLYFLEGFGRGVTMKSPTKPNSHELMMFIPETQTSRVSLSVNADDVRVYQATCDRFSMTGTIPPFAALSGRGALHLVSCSWCDFYAMLTLAIECDSDGLRIHASSRVVELPPLMPDLEQVSCIREVVPLYAVTNKGRAFTCRVETRLPGGVLVDTHQISGVMLDTCVCLGPCDCECNGQNITKQGRRNANETVPQECIIDWNPETDDGALSGGGFNLRRIFSALGLSWQAGMALFSTFLAIGLLAAMIKCGVLQYCFGSAQGAKVVVRQQGTKLKVVDEQSDPIKPAQDQRSRAQQCCHGLGKTCLWVLSSLAAAIVAGTLAIWHCVSKRSNPVPQQQGEEEQRVRPQQLVTALVTQHHQQPSHSDQQEAHPQAQIAVERPQQPLLVARSSVSSPPQHTTALSVFKPDVPSSHWHPVSSPRFPLHQPPVYQASSGQPLQKPVLYTAMQAPPQPTSIQLSCVKQATERETYGEDVAETSISQSSFWEEDEPEACDTFDLSNHLQPPSFARTDQRRTMRRSTNVMDVLVSKEQVRLCFDLDLKVCYYSY